MAYCDWSDVTSVFPHASTIEGTGANQTALLAEATELTDTYLAGIMRTPIQVRAEDSDYPAVVKRICALLCANLVAERRFDGPEDQPTEIYGDHVYTGTRFGHKAMSMIQALRQAKAFTPEQDTEPDLSIPKLDVSTFSSTNGIVEARLVAGRFMRETKTLYTFTIQSDGGTVAGEDLTVSVKRDYDEDVYSAASPMEIKDTGWHSIEGGLQVRFRDAESSAAWAQDETFEIECEPWTDQVEDAGVTSREIYLV